MNSPVELQPRLPEHTPVFLCPSCQCQLVYEGSLAREDKSPAIELSDRYQCPSGCGKYEYDRKSHRLFGVP